YYTTQILSGHGLFRSKLHERGLQCLQAGAGGSRVVAEVFQAIRPGQRQSPGARRLGRVSQGTTVVSNSTAYILLTDNSGLAIKL
ncbi:hypothetical protein L9F63_017227, partial [Diploptera punctata]